MDYRDSFTASIHQLENQLNELNAQRRNEEGLKQSMNFLDSLGISTTADDEMDARFHQQVDAGSDYHYDQDNWLASAPDSEGRNFNENSVLPC